MKRTVAPLIVLVAMMLSLDVHAAWRGSTPDPSLHGVLIETQGPVTIASPEGRSLGTAVGTELEPGSTVNTGEGGRALIMLMNGAVITIAEHESYLVGVFPPTGILKPVMLKGLTVALSEAVLLQLPITASAMSARNRTAPPHAKGVTKMGRVGPDRPPPPVVPMGRKRANHVEGIHPVETSIILPDKLTFEWRGRLLPDDPALVLEDVQHDRRTFDIPHSRSTKLTVDANRLGLTRGDTYSWYLASRGDKPGRGRTRRFAFSVLTAHQEKLLQRDVDTIDSIAQTPDGRAFMKGQLCFNYGMNYKMVETLLPLWKKHRSSALKKLLKLGYARLGRPDEVYKYR